MTMKAAILEAPGSPITIRDIPIPKVGGADVLLKTKYAGVCSTDLKVMTGKKRVDYLDFPIVLGHELVGEVVDLGPKHELFKRGDHLAPFPAVFCGRCPLCLSGEHRLCQGSIKALGYNIQGGFAEYTRIPGEMFDNSRSRVFRVPDGISLKVASVLEPIACCFHGIGQSRVKLGDTVLIMGLGFMGLVMLQIARMFGAAHVVGVDPIPERREMALELGADAALSPEAEEYESQMREYTSGIGADAVIAALAIPEVFEKSLQWVKAGGTLNLFGGAASGSQITIDPNIIHYKEVSLVGTAGYRFQDGHRILELLRRDVLHIEKLIKTYPLEQINEAFNANLRKQGAKNVIAFE